MGRLGASVLAGAALLAAAAQPVLAAGTTQRVSVTSAGKQANGHQGSISGDGPVSFAAISGDGRWLTFATTATSMVPNDRNGTFDVSLRDRLAGETVPVSVTPGGAVGNGLSVSPFVSDDGSLVASP